MPDDYVKRSDVHKVFQPKYAPAINRTFAAMIDSVPAADVVEVKHGRWHRFSKGNGAYNGVIILSDAFQCTVCKESFWNKSNYCPSCGAIMDGGPDK